MIDIEIQQSKISAKLHTFVNSDAELAMCALVLLRGVFGAE